MKKIIKCILQLFIATLLMTSCYNDISRTSLSTDSQVINRNTGYDPLDIKDPVFIGIWKSSIRRKEAEYDEKSVDYDHNYVHHLSVNIEYQIEIVWAGNYYDKFKDSSSEDVDDSSKDQSPMPIGMYPRDTLGWKKNPKVTIIRDDDDFFGADYLFYISCSDKITDTIEFYDKTDQDDDYFFIRVSFE